jgi:hypothetical protein
MKKKSIFTLTLLGFCVSHADYFVTIPLEINNIKFDNWVPTDKIISMWQMSGSIYDCSNWSPLASTITIEQPFVQTATDCKQNQVRTVQERELDKVSGNVRNVGAPYTETQVIQVTDTKNALGSKETWASISSSYTTWTNDGSIINCSNWSPAPSTVTIGTSYTQTATDCQQPQIRSRQDREQEMTTGSVRNVGAAVTESQSITASSTRAATGAKETWVAISSTSTAWVNDGALTGCSNWSPATSTVPANQAFTQTATDCKQPQTSIRQDREQETTTLAIRNKGVAVTETQTLTVSSTRSATGTKIMSQQSYNSNTRVILEYCEGTTGGYIKFMWNGTQVGITTGTWSSVANAAVNYGGYRYTVGPYVDNMDWDDQGCGSNGDAMDNYYYIIRTPL